MSNVCIYLCDITQQTRYYIIKQQTILTHYDSNFNCNGFKDCSDQILHCKDDGSMTPCSLTCNGDYSCFNIVLFCPIEGNCAVECGGDNSCKMITINAARTTQGQLSVTGTGNNAFYKSSIYCPRTDSCSIKAQSGTEKTIMFKEAIIAAQSTTTLLDVSFDYIDILSAVTPVLTIICPSAAASCIYLSDYLNDPSKPLMASDGTETSDGTQVSEYHCDEANKCTGNVYQCVENEACNIYCNNTGDGESNSCWGSLFICPSDKDCTIHCNGYRNVCQHLNVIGGESGKLSILFGVHKSPGSPRSTSFRTIFCPFKGDCYLSHVPYLNGANIIANGTNSSLTVRLALPPVDSTRIKCPNTNCTIEWIPHTGVSASMLLFVHDMQSGWSVSSGNFSSVKDIQIICNEDQSKNCGNVEAYIDATFVGCNSSATCYSVTCGSEEEETCTTSETELPTSGPSFSTTLYPTFAPALYPVTSHPTASYPTTDTWIDWSMEMKYNINYQTFLDWIDSINKTPLGWAKDHIESMIAGTNDSSSSQYTTDVGVIVQSVKSGSVIISYVLESKSISLLEVALERIDTNSNRDQFVIKIDGYTYTLDYNKRMDEESGEYMRPVTIILLATIGVLLVIMMSILYWHVGVCDRLCKGNSDEKDLSDNIDVATKTATPTTQNCDPKLQKSEKGDDENNKLRNWLTSIQLELYFDKFVEHGYGKQMSSLSELNDDDLKRIGITLEHDRTKLLAHIWVMNKNEGNKTQMAAMEIDADNVPEGGDIANGTMDPQKSHESDKQPSDEDMY